MSVIKQISIFNGSNWDTPADIGANAENIDFTYTTGSQQGNTAALSSILPAQALTASRVLTTDSNGKLSSSNISSGVLNTALSGASTVSSLQSQINTLNTNLDNKVHKGISLTNALITSNDSANQWMQIWSENDVHGIKGLTITNQGISAYDSTNSQAIWSLTNNSIQITVTRNSGATISSITSYRYGNIIQMRIDFSINETVTPGNNLFTGTFNGPLPLTPITVTSYQVKAHFQSHLQTNGSLTCRVLGTNSIGAGKVGCTFIYLTNS